MKFYCVLLLTTFDYHLTFQFSVDLFYFSMCSPLANGWRRDEAENLKTAHKIYIDSEHQQMSLSHYILFEFFTQLPMESV